MCNGLNVRTYLHNVIENTNTFGNLFTTYSSLRPSSMTCFTRYTLIVYVRTLKLSNFNESNVANQQIMYKTSIKAYLSPS